MADFFSLRARGFITTVLVAGGGVTPADGEVPATCDNQVLRFMDTRFSVKSMCLLWYLCIVQILKSIVVISIEYRPWSVV
jgi:hypothetical protein